MKLTSVNMEDLNLNSIKSQMSKVFANYFSNERNVTSLEKPIEFVVSEL